MSVKGLIMASIHRCLKITQNSRGIFKLMYREAQRIAIRHSEGNIKEINTKCPCT